MEYPKSKAIYDRTNRFAEKWSRISNFILVYVSAPLYVFPKAIISYIIYYTTDAGPDAFGLPLPVW